MLMRRNILYVILLFVAGVGVCAAQETNLESDVTRVINHAQTALNSVSQADSTAAPEVLPLWKQKLYYGYNFDIYYHQDSRSNRKENGWSVEGPWHKRYFALYKKAATFDNHVAQHYDGMSAGHYIDGVIRLYCDGIITDEEIAVLSDEPRELIMRFKDTMG